MITNKKLYLTHIVGYLLGKKVDTYKYLNM